MGKLLENIHVDRVSDRFVKDKQQKDTLGKRHAYGHGMVIRGAHQPSFGLSQSFSSVLSTQSTIPSHFCDNRMHFVSSHWNSIPSIQVSLSSVLVFALIWFDLIWWCWCVFWFLVFLMITMKINESNEKEKIKNMIQKLDKLIGTKWK